MPYEYFFKPTRVVDGDTVDGFIDLGFSVHRKIRVRLGGIDAPETRTRDKEEKVFGFAAKEKLEQMLDGCDRVMIKSLGVGKFGRCLGVLFRADDEDESKWINLNEELVTQGFAVEYWGGDRSRKKADKS